MARARDLGFRHLALLAITALTGLVAVTSGSGAAFSALTNNPGNTVTAAADFRAPAVSSTVIAKTTGFTPGFVKLTGTYYVYANVSDSGNPASGIASVTADVSNLTLTATSVTLSSGSFSVGGVSYNYRSASQTMNTAASGATSYTITTTDSASNSATTSGSVTVDNIVPTASDIQTTNVGGGTNGKAEANDTIVFTYSEPIDPESILSGWTGSSTNVVVRLTNGLLLSDKVTVFNSADSSQLPLGSVDLARTDYVAGAVGGEIARFGATGTASTMVMSGSTITITLGTASGQAATTTALAAAMIWTPSTSAYDRAGNAALVTPATESGAADKDF